MEPLPPQSELSIGLSTSQHTTTTAAAWHVLGLLLSHGRPVRPSELASSCAHFYPTPEFIRFICSIPNSPLRIVDNHFVTFSEVGVAAIAQFFANSDLITRYLDLPHFLPRLLESFGLNDTVSTYCRKRKRLIQEEDEDFSLKKRKSYLQEINEEMIPNQMVMMMPSGSQSAYAQSIETLSSLSSLSQYDCWKLRKIISRPLMVSKSRPARRLTYEIENAGHEQNETPDAERPGCLHGDSCNSSIHRTVAGDFLINSVTPVPLLELSHPPCTRGNSEGKRISDIKIVNPTDCLNICASSKLEVEQKIKTGEKSEAANQGCESLPGDVKGRIKEVLLLDSGGGKSHKEINLMDRTRRNGFNNKAVCLVRSKPQDHLQIPGEMPNHLIKHSESDNDGADDRTESICPTTENCKCLQDKGLEQFKGDKDQTSEKQTKFCCEQNIDIKEKRDISAENRRRASCIHKNIEQKPFPDFELYIVEEEEGSGGYGTVYRARRKKDGLIFAIKCPHGNANKNYVSNEIKMLERLGGKNFVIKYEGSFQSGNADFVVLEHVDHDRPEILRREMHVTDLQWYAYCLFKALAGLHKQGIVHRDVKPGNFLYSRKVNKGFLIDFNLALDMRKKYGTSDSSRVRHSLNDPFGNPQMKSLPPAKSRKPMNTSGDQNGGKVSKSILPPGNLKKEFDKAKHSSSRNVIKSQGADGSGITSAKDATSTRTLSAEKLREPLPSQGRKALLNLAHEAMQGGNHESVNTPKSKRKRVAAPAAAGDADTRFLYTTPMPLHANGIAICGAGLLKNSKGDGKHRREGPCVGTKGFKAPEVLLRSLYQGPKADIWSAGVTLLYLMIGRTPFVGDANQNIKEIAKLRGSEDLWEVAKLHNNEALFPMDLLDVKYLSPMNLRDWCGRNTRRRDIFEAIPASLFDLVDKCLMVNPRQRISAEEALRHEFFAPCYEAFRKYKRGK
ncbi:hypothetical protein ACS0TY_016546 [Phlomoides rotata]